MSKLLKSLNPKQALILFDGECAVCDKFVMWLVDHDQTSALRFCSLQSDAAKPFLRKFGFPSDYLESSIFVYDDVPYNKSSGVIRSVAFLGFPWNLVKALIVIPPPLRDYCYDVFARNRIRMFGKKNHDLCRRMTPDMRARIVGVNDICNEHTSTKP